MPGRSIGLCLRIRGSVFIRSISATPVVACALNPQDDSSSSSLTSTKVSLLASLQPEKRKVGGSIPPLATIIDLRGRGDNTLWMVGFVRFLSVRLVSDGAVEPVEIRGYVVEFI